MKRIHYKTEMKYLDKVADYLIQLGYEVSEPSTRHRDLLDVWGTVKGRKCYQEIYVTIYEFNGGINGIWHQGDHDGVEVYLNDLGELQDACDLVDLLNGLKPLHRVETKKGNL